MKRLFSKNKQQSQEDTKSEGELLESYDVSKFNPKPILFPFKAMNVNFEKLSDLRKTQKDIGISLYSPSTLLTLLKRKDICIEEVGNQKCKAVRYLIKENGDLVFGNEGYPDRTTPAHCQMVGDPSDYNIVLKCVTAGNAFFDDNNKLILINHKSGDFRPSFESLKIALAKFLENNIPMNDTFIVAELTHKGGYKKNYLCDTAELKKNLSSTTTPKLS